ncbi:CHM2A protein, partial [Tachuris rubrigastra]|nr:CHM2A protein [Tachuris rubrigastra]
MLEFERQAELMDMKEELMNDAIDDALGDEDDEEERWGQPGDREGTQGHGNLGMWGQGDVAFWGRSLPPPGGSLAAGEGRGGAEAAAALADADADLEERLKNLRRD